VQSLATPQKPADTLLVSGRQFSARFALPLLFFGALWFVLCRQLSGEWLVNEQSTAEIRIVLDKALLCDSRQLA
jgi:hypothetical protein